MGEVVFDVVYRYFFGVVGVFEEFFYYVRVVVYRVWAVSSECAVLDESLNRHGT